MVVASASKKARLGAKHRCARCGTRYYDFGRAVVVCPKCGAPARDDDGAATRALTLVPPPASDDGADDDAVKRARLLGGLSAEELDLAARDDADQLAELLVSYDW